MDTANEFSLVGGLLILVVVLLASGQEVFSFLRTGRTGLPQGGYRYYIGSDTVLYIYPRKTNCRVYALEGDLPEGFAIHQSRAGAYIVLTVNSPAEAEIMLERAYMR